jgi:hypothetical protein
MATGLRSVVVGSVLLVAACASAPPRELSQTVPQGVHLATGASPLDQTHVDERVAQIGLFGYLVQQRGHRLQVLELSGGGQYGAFGAGFLNGWSEQGTRPQFDLVTGISTKMAEIVGP